MQNTEYVAQRNALIPSAVAFANKKAGANPQSNAGREAWNKAFHAKMDELSRSLTGRSMKECIAGRA